MTQTSNFLALDVGTKRIGVAVADNGVSIARPLTYISVDDTEIDQIAALYTDHNIQKIIVGYPRNQSGDATAQTALVEAFADRLAQRGLPIVFQDESVTSIQAESYLKQTKKPYQKGDIDAVAAAIILTDFLEQHRDR